MILLCKVGGRVVDRVTITDQTITYETRAAKDVVDAKIDSLGRQQAIRLLRDWSNGYVTFSELK